MTAPPNLLGSDEPAPFQIVQAQGRSRFVLCCDHAGRRLPRALGDLGVDASELQRHIAWDIGAAGVALQLATTLDACAILQPYSRLAIDCNRPLEAADSIATRSEDTVIPGNQLLSAHEAARRAQAIFHPYHAQLRAELDRRQRAASAPILVSLHSFTPVYQGVTRPWQIGVLYHRDARLGHALLALLQAEQRWTVGDNQPYAVDDEHDYTVPQHGERRGIAHVELEIRQDLIADSAGQAYWAALLARLLPLAAAAIHAA
ncbi:MAG: N-formylglutamate amidohydrolase [Nevskia sp.]|nr:N-formylglutamate amidohydrolase [Nevskia sp.]